MLRRYDYRCPGCGREVEVREDLDPSHNRYCHECGVQMHRKPSSVTVVFKGSGFYVNDSKGSKEGKSSD